MELRDYLDVLRRWLWLLALSTAVASAGAWVGTRFMPITYRSTTTLMVGRALDNPEVSAQTIYLSNQLATLYSQMATREPVLQSVVESLDLPVSWQQLRGMINSQPQPGTPLFEISVVATNPELTQVLADNVADALIAQTAAEQLRTEQQDAGFLRDQLAKVRTNIESTEADRDQLQSKLDTATSARQISELQGQIAGKDAQLNEFRSRYSELSNQLSGSAVNALSLMEAAAPGIRVGPNVRMNVLLAALLGLGLALAAVLLLEYLDDTVKSPANLERRTGLAGLAAVPNLGQFDKRAEGLITVNNPRAPAAEVYRTLRTNLQFALLQREPGPVVFTSANAGEGKSTTISNVAIVLAQIDQNVLLIDGDLRKPSLHKFFGLTNSRGLTSLMLDREASLADYVQQVDDLPGLQVLTSGPLPPNPSELVASERMAEILEEAQGFADLVLIDSPPVLLVTDPVVMSRNASAVLLVFDAGATRIDGAKMALETLARAGVQALGAVVNKLDPSLAGGYYLYAYRSDYKGYGDYYDGDAGSDGPSGQGRSRPEPTSGSLAGWRQRLGDALSALLS